LCKWEIGKVKLDQLRAGSIDSTRILPILFELPRKIAEKRHDCGVILILQVGGVVFHALEVRRLLSERSENLTPLLFAREVICTCLQDPLGRLPSHFEFFREQGGCLALFEL
jgi:hypothetical protein